MSESTAERKPLSESELDELPVFSELHSTLINVLIDRGAQLPRGLVFELEDALLKSLAGSETRRDFVELQLLAAGAPQLIRSVEHTWPNSRVIVSPFQDPESMGVQLALIIGGAQEGLPKLADEILGEDGRIAERFSQLP